MKTDCNSKRSEFIFIFNILIYYACTTKNSNNNSTDTYASAREWAEVLDIDKSI